MPAGANQKAGLGPPAQARDGRLARRSRRMRSGAVAASEPGGHHDVVRGLHPGRHRRRQAAELGLRRVCVRYGPVGAGGRR